MLFVRKLIWDAWNTQHISRHNVTPDEVEAVCHGDSIVLRGQKKGRLVLIGSVEDVRILTVILEGKGQGKYCPVTAFESDDQDISLYKRLKGGDNNEKNEKDK